MYIIVQQNKRREDCAFAPRAVVLEYYYALIAMPKTALAPSSIASDNVGWA
jgi:hypothetical protein